MWLARLATNPRALVRVKDEADGTQLAHLFVLLCMPVDKWGNLRKMNCFTPNTEFGHVPRVKS